VRSFASAGVLLALSSPFCTAAEPPVTPSQTVTALEETFGVHPGERRNHIKGTCAKGIFIGSNAAHPFTRSALFSGDAIPVVARFSLPGGNPQIPDYARVPRGLALEFRLPGGSRQHMTMLNTPMFGASTPKTFYDAVVAKRPDPATGKPDPAKLKAFRASHPDALAQSEYLAAHTPPVSWTNETYYGIHTFLFINKKNETTPVRWRTTPVRWRFVPQDGEKRFSDKALAQAPSSFLERRLIERVKAGPVRWDMILTIGEPGDPQNNPTLTWPASRKEVKVGTLTILSAAPQKGGECEKINYDPLVMTDGINPSNDPVLLFRSPAYAISFGKRMRGE